MTPAGWITLTLCWTFVTGLSIYLIVKTLRAPHHTDDAPVKPDTDITRL